MFPGPTGSGPAARATYLRSCATYLRYWRRYRFPCRAPKCSVRETVRRSFDAGLPPSSKISAEQPRNDRNSEQQTDDRNPQ
jgi:hypothetical protein